MDDSRIVDTSEIPSTSVPHIDSPVRWKPYEPERQRDVVRMVVTLGLLVSFVGLIFWACRESVTSATVWTQTKDMLQSVLPALSGLLGSVIGFYFGASAGADRRP